VDFARVAAIDLVQNQGRKGHQFPFHFRPSLERRIILSRRKNASNPSNSAAAFMDQLAALNPETYALILAQPLDVLVLACSHLVACALDAR
jgi:hypothetical protein